VAFKFNQKSLFHCWYPTYFLVSFPMRQQTFLLESRNSCRIFFSAWSVNLIFLLFLHNKCEFKYCANLFHFIFVLFLRCSTIPTEQSPPPSLLNISIIELSLPHNNKSICWAETYVLVLRSTVTCGGTIVNASGMILSKRVLEVLRKKFFNKQLPPIYVFDPWFHPILISKAVIRGISFIICQFNFMLIIIPISLFPLFYLGWQGFSYSITYG